METLWVTHKDVLPAYLGAQRSSRTPGRWFLSCCLDIRTSLLVQEPVVFVVVYR